MASVVSRRARPPADPPVPLPAAAEAAPRRPRGRPRKTLDERDDGNRRRELIAGAARLFRRKGFDGTSTRDIAAAVGMRSGSPFYHFKSKQALLNAVMEEGMRRAIAQQAQALQAAGVDPEMLQKKEHEIEHPQELLAVLVRNHFRVLLGPQSDFIPVMLYEWRSLTPRQRNALATLQGEYEALWVPVLRALQARGLLRTELKLARLLIFGALNWSVQWFDPRQGASLDALAEAAMALFLPTEAAPA